MGPGPRGSGVKLVVLADTGNRFGDAMQDEFAEWEREEIAKRTQDGLLKKCRSDLVNKKSGRRFDYYSCRSRQNTGPSRNCGNRKYLRAELHVTREAAERRLEAARAGGEALRRLGHDKNALMESCAGVVSESLGDIAPEERHLLHKLLRLGVRFRPDWPLEITGVFAEVGEEAEAGSSECKLSPRSFPHDEPPTLKFYALLTESGAERLELARA